MAYDELTWKADYSVGVDEIDEQHKQLFNVVNTFLSAKAQGKKDEVLKETFIHLVEYTTFHFSTEEKHMEKNKYYGLTEHKRQHEVLIKQVVQILQNLKNGKELVYDDLASLLKVWLLKHILDQDKQYGYYLKD